MTITWQHRCIHTRRQSLTNSQPRFAGTLASYVHDPKILIQEKRDYWRVETNAAIPKHPAAKLAHFAALEFKVETSEIQGPRSMASPIFSPKTPFSFTGFGGFTLADFLQKFADMKLKMTPVHVNAVETTFIQQLTKEIMNL